MLYRVYEGHKYILFVPRSVCRRKSRGEEEEGVHRRAVEAVAGGRGS
jgi:hypothetical protein